MTTTTLAKENNNQISLLSKEDNTFTICANKIVVK